MEDRCEDCGLELHVTGSENVVRYDDTPDVATRLYMVIHMTCENPQCISYHKDITCSVEQLVKSEKTPVQLE